MSLTGISKSTKYFPATRMCWSRGISSQSKQHIVSPVKKRVALCAKWSLIFVKWPNKALFFVSSFFTNINFNFEYMFSINVATSLSFRIENKKFYLWELVQSINSISIRFSHYFELNFDLVIILNVNFDLVTILNVITTLNSVAMISTCTKRL